MGLLVMARRKPFLIGRSKQRVSPSAKGSPSFACTLRHVVTLIMWIDLTFDKNRFAVLRKAVAEVIKVAVNAKKLQFSF